MVKGERVAEVQDGDNQTHEFPDSQHDGNGQGGKFRGQYSDTKNAKKSCV